MTTLNDGCTAGPLSAALNTLIRICCEGHDLALDHSYDLWTFIQGNSDFFWCAYNLHPWLAPIVFAVVAGPFGLYFYWFGPKRKPEPLPHVVIKKEDDGDRSA